MALTLPIVACLRTSWSLGEAEDLLGKYAWYIVNSPSGLRPVGLLRPNELGLFDLHGNVWEWCHNRPEAFMDIKDLQKDDIMDIRSGRPMRGGAFLNYALLVRSACRSGDGPAGRFIHFGFRPARTFR